MLSYPYNRIRMEDEQYYRRLVQRYCDRTATDEELEVFIKLLDEGKLDVHLKAAMDHDAGITAEDEIDFSAPSKTIRMWPRIVAAAALFLMLSTAGYIVLRKPSPKSSALTAVQQPRHIRPGQYQATLTLTSGKKIVLSKGLSGKLAQEGNTKVMINSAGEVIYIGSGVNGHIGYNTLATTDGEQSPYPLVLPDGTKVWLNSSSSIVFPTSFKGESRQVKIKGEAYFVVAHHPSKPFKVHAGNQVVEDIGTVFNIKSYSDEPAIGTTLIEGAAKVIANGQFRLLTPGQRTLVTPNSISLGKADTEAETAWMSGYFVFHNEDLHSVMRQLARWYEIQVVYDYDPVHITIGGGFAKKRTLSEVLKAFEQSAGLKFRVDGHTVHVIK
jgi:transmembrane sensor